MTISIGHMADHVLRSFGAVLFTAKRRSGFFFLLAILLSPLHLAAGLAGVSFGILTGHFLAPDSPWQKLGFPGGAGFLTALALVAFLPAGPALYVLIPAVSSLSALILLSLASGFAIRNLSILALPLVLATWVGLGAAELFGLNLQIQHTSTWTLPIFATWDAGLAHILPPVAQDFLSTFGSLLFHPGQLSGALVLIGILFGSRITAIAMLLGGLIGSLLLAQLVPGLHHEELGLIAFNAVLTAAAMTGVFVAITRNGLLWSLAATLVSVLLTASLHVVFQDLNLPVLALPFCLSVWLFLIPLHMGVVQGWRTDIWAPPLALVGRAEDNLRAFERWRRGLKQAYPVLTLPLHGLWKITQGVGGTFTHNSETGRYAWDFMLIDEEGHAATWPGTECDDFHGYGCPVLAPADGFVTAMEGSLPDNEVGAVDTKNPWGNWIMLTHDEGTVSLLAHLRPGSLRVALGQRIHLGQEIAQVGNSGRSPEPHLHYQLNATPWLAAQSLDAQFGSFVEFHGEKAIFRPLGKLEERASVCNLRALDWPSWADFHPLGIPGSIWKYRGSDGSDHSLKLEAGLSGRLILDDGFQRVQLVWWQGWIQLLALPEGDLDRLETPHAELGPLYWLLLLSPVLPLKGVDGLVVQHEIHHMRLAHPLRRLFTLEGQGDLEMQFDMPNGDSPLTWKSRLQADQGQPWEATFASIAKEGLSSLHVTRKGQTVAQFTFIVQTRERL